MQSSYTASLAAILKSEGGYVNDPRDPGGATMKGVIQRVYDAYRSRMGVALRSVREIADIEVQAIYKYQYWDAVRGDELPAGLDYCVFDYGINSGPSRAIKALQTALGTKPDGLIGHITIAAAMAADSSAVIGAVCNARLSFLKKLSTWRTFGNGWTARVESVRKLALAMVRTKAAVGEIMKPPAPDGILHMKGSVLPPEPQRSPPAPVPVKPVTRPVGQVIRQPALPAAGWAGWWEDIKAKFGGR